MDPFTASLIIGGGTKILSGISGAENKKKQMLAAAEQTRYSPWTGSNGNAAFNEAAKQNPFADTIQGLAGTAGSAFAQSAADDKFNLMKQAQLDAKSGGQMSALDSYKMPEQPKMFGGENQDNPWDLMNRRRS